MTINRRRFIKTTAIGTAAVPIISGEVFGASGRKPKLVIVRGKSVVRMLELGMAELGGFSNFVKTGQKATVKPNAAWESRPDEGGNTDPLLMGAVVKGCVAAGAKEVVVPENNVGHPTRSFETSGIKSAVEKAGGRMYPLKEDSQFKSVKVPGGKSLKSVEVAKDILETGCLINVPIAKSHSGAILTVSMKNWMGSVKDRRYWHRNNLDQCIADCSTVIKPTLVIVDATRIMVENGPRGPGPLEYPNKIILSTDPVAADAYAATLFGKKPFEIPHIRIAHEMGIGQGELGRVNMVEIDAY